MTSVLQPFIIVLWLSLVLALSRKKELEYSIEDVTRVGVSESGFQWERKV